MTKNRLEAFSDGVFAIACTLLVLDVKLPDTEIRSNRQLIGVLLGTMPNVLIFIFTFLVVGVFWVAHLRILDLVKQVNHFLLWTNIIYLLTIAIIPFPASTLARHPFLIASIVFYSFILFLCGIQHIVILIYLRRHPDLLEKQPDAKAFKQAMNISLVGPACYVMAMTTCFIGPAFSFCFIVGALIFYILLAPKFLRNFSE